MYDFVIKDKPTPRWTSYVFHQQGRTVKHQVWSLTCLWYHVCRATPIRLVIVRDSSDVQKDDFFFGTDATPPGAPDWEIIQRYFERWGVEESILEGKQLMGFDNMRGWCSQTVKRQAPLAMVLTTLVKCWYVRRVVKEPSLLSQTMPWHRYKMRPSFADMLSALRRVIWSHRISPNSCMSRKVQEIIETLTYALSAAAYKDLAVSQTHDSSYHYQKLHGCIIRQVREHAECRSCKDQLSSYVSEQFILMRSRPGNHCLSHNII